MSDSLRGQFLIAAKTLQDPNFFRTVVLIVEHGEHGAMGVVVNRPSNVSVSQALVDHFEMADTGSLVYVGGPVEPNGLFILHNAGDVEDQTSAIVPGVYVGNNPHVFEQVIESVIEGDQELQYRVYSGCAGWGTNQLESELARNDWHLCTATPKYVFAEEPYETWDTLMEQIHRANRLFPQHTENPEWN